MFSLANFCPNPSNLLDNPSKTVNRFNLNGQETAGVSMSSFPVTGFTAASGNRIQSWTIETKTLDTITEIALTNSPNVVGPIRYRLFDSFDGVTEVIGATVGQVLRVNAENIERIVITTDNPTSDGQPPRNLKLTLNGCYRGDSLATKAQVESVTTTTAQGLLDELIKFSSFSFFFFF